MTGAERVRAIFDRELAQLEQDYETFEMRAWFAALRDEVVGVVAAAEQPVTGVGTSTLEIVWGPQMPAPW